MAVVMLIYLGVIIFVLSLLHRLVKAQEQSSRHLLEIVRDLKILTDQKRG